MSFHTIFAKSKLFITPWSAAKVPESVTKMSSQWLHNQSAFALKARLLYRPDTVVVSVPVHIDVDADGDD